MELNFYGTYYFCHAVREVLVNSFDYRDTINDFFSDNRALELIRPYEKYSAFHWFIDHVIRDSYYEENINVDLEERKKILESFQSIPEALEDLKPTILPIEEALQFHNIDHESFESFLKDRHKLFKDCTDDDLYDYIQELALPQDYEGLVEMLTKEVFHILFNDRNLLLTFNELLSSYLMEVEWDEIENDDKIFFRKNRTLLRKPPPKWVQDAVFFRDRGQCVLCGMDLTRTVNLKNKMNYDHIVPLAKCGSNDITNIQLLCDSCNNTKRDQKGNTTGRYMSWYDY